MAARPGELWVGIDWSDRTHDVAIVDGHEESAQTFQVDHSASGLDELVTRLRSAGEVRGIAIESTRHLVVAKLLESGFTVFLVNPKIAKAWREGWKVTPSKTDSIDAWVLAEGLRHHHARMQPLAPDDDSTRELRMLVEDEMRLIHERTALINLLQDCLKMYFPAALNWFSDWGTQSAWDFILAFPTPDRLVRAKPKTLFGFLKKHRIGCSKPVWVDRVDRRGEAADWPVDPATVRAKSELAVSVAKQLRTLEASLKRYRAGIEGLFDRHADAEIFLSLPGAGPKLAPRLLVSFGSDRDRYEDATSLQKLSGTVPRTVQSGKGPPSIKFRWACRKGFRSTMHQFAWQTTNYCPWARAFYGQARAKGQSHSLALRNLASKWMKIIYRMWKERAVYDEARYLEQLESRHSPLAALVAVGS